MRPFVDVALVGELYSCLRVAAQSGKFAKMIATYMNTYPKSAKYAPDWVAANWMGPHPLWLLEELCGNLNLQPGMKVLDMGCGKGLTSVFLAKEFGVTVFANDLWISATENLRRFEEAGGADLVFPIHAEAHALPYAEGFFDVAIAVDCYHYFGTDDAYFPGVFAKLVKDRKSTRLNSSH